MRKIARVTFSYCPEEYPSLAAWLASLPRNERSTRIRETLDKAAQERDARECILDDPALRELAERLAEYLGDMFSTPLEVSGPGDVPAIEVVIDDDILEAMQTIGG